MATTISHPGQANLAGDVNALFQTIFGGEVLTAFRQTAVCEDKKRVRNLVGAKSAKFPVIGSVSCDYHVAGVDVEGGAVEHNERQIDLQRPLLASVAVDDWEDKVIHYDIRQPYAAEIGRTLAITSDRHSFINIALAARVTDEIVTGAPIGDVIENADMRLTGDTVAGTATTVLAKANAIASAIIDAEAKLTAKNVPASEMKYCVLNTTDYFSLLKAALEGQAPWLNKDFSGSGRFSNSADSIVIGNVHVFSCSHFIDGDTIAASGAYAQYNGDFSKTVGLVWTKDAIGTVKLNDIVIETERTVRSQATLIVGKRAEGHGILRPECAVELVLPAA